MFVNVGKIQSSKQYPFTSTVSQFRVVDKRTLASPQYEIDGVEQEKPKQINL